MPRSRGLALVGAVVSLGAPEVTVMATDLSQSEGMVSVRTAVSSGWSRSWLDQRSPDRRIRGERSRPQSWGRLPAQWHLDFLRGFFPTTPEVNRCARLAVERRPAPPSLLPDNVRGYPVRPASTASSRHNLFSPKGFHLKARGRAAHPGIGNARSSLDFARRAFITPPGVAQRTPERGAPSASRA